MEGKEILIRKETKREVISKTVISERERRKEWELQAA